MKFGGYRDIGDKVLLPIVKLVVFLPLYVSTVEFVNWRMFLCVDDALFGCADSFLRGFLSESMVSLTV